VQYELSLLGEKTELKVGDTGEIKLLEGRVTFFRGDFVLFPRLAESKTSVIRGFAIWSAMSEPMSLEEAKRAVSVIGAFARHGARITSADDLLVRFRFENGEGIGGKFTGSDRVRFNERTGKIQLIRGKVRASSDELALEWGLYPLDSSEAGAWADLIATLVRKNLEYLSDEGGVIEYGVKSKEGGSGLSLTPAFPNLQRTYAAKKPRGRKPPRMPEEPPTYVRKNLARLREAGMLADRPSVKPRSKELAQRRRPRSA
jgi:hypothetical protein